MIDYLIFFLFVLVAFAGLISHVFGFPGNFIILADSILFGWYGGFKEVTITVLAILLVLALLGELVEFVLGIVGAKKYKSSNKAIVGSIVFGIIGGILGIPFFFGIGAVIGAFIGVFVGAFLVEFVLEKNVDRAMKSGWGAFVGRLGGTFFKGAIGIAMIVITIVSVLGN
ncbi:MAG: DUF456 domain-containing protein [Candidatus Dadabacteria bacterium]|nr:DUF456 domain-containing protein [Candidatus Dadabacteria bacterium]MCZ6554944.1 DUF456 domain-containing protein [Candidatus Dadabacteria bacterium]MCZ6791259.1 DUF456 domain-containing protein [Candidatus Dadabacteria bacterium]MCZ6865255.1 DUF456 domain-containing protein [Candidatus Dadabacteria bacterium]